METVEDFDQWLANYRPAPAKFVAVFDPQTGKVISVGPECAFVNEKHQVAIDTETAESIITAEIQIEKCRIDITSGSLEIAEIKTLTKLDDVLHRIISTEFATTVDADVFLTYVKKTKILKIQLTSVFGGTKKIKNSQGRRNLIWDGSTEMDFFITDYNDPHLIFDTCSVTINDLVGKTVTVKDISQDRFSVYTRRLFKNYVIEHK